ncbi:MAG: hypothetical protein ICV51_19730 [Flavisolibacter sp.]|nr:hypothetical protein [Flavisolibacter sp.]MBD0377844.1 hypothetical protein [Flavisolibacter sp.]
MAFYSKEEADYLIVYYLPKVIGGLLDPSIGSRVKRVYKEPVGDKYAVRGQGTPIKEVLHPSRTIELIAQAQNLPSPEEVLRRNFI